jgi:nitrogen fixation protein FixH
MACFILFIVSMGVKMATSNQALYEDDYYEQGEMHAERMEQQQAGQEVTVSFNRRKNSLDVNFDGTGYVSSYKLVFLADNTQDVEDKDLVHTPVEKQSIAIPQELKTGIWYFEVQGSIEGQSFFKKEQFVK